MFPRKPTVPKQTATGALDDMACAEAYAKQTHQPTWVKVVGVALGVLLFVAVLTASLYRGRQSLGLGIAAVCVVALVAISPWLCYSAACPRCKRDMQTGLRVRCHRCREPFTDRRCEPCGVDFSWGAGFGGANAYANQLPIRYCPGCGAYVNSDLTLETTPSDNLPSISDPYP